MSHIIKQLSQKQLNIIDPSLNTSNASKKGYRHVEDIPNLYQALLDLLEYAQKQGYKLGVPDGKHNQHYFGLYCKTDKTNDTKETV